MGNNRVPVIVGALLLLDFAGHAVAQTTKTPKKFIPPRDLYVSNPVLASERGCLRDYLKAMGADGIARRKQLDDLQRYECIHGFEGMYKVFILESQSVDVSGTAIQARKVRIILDMDFRKLISESPPLDQPLDGEGWVPANVLLSMSVEEKRAFIEDFKKQHR
jgi:hypothetical protein